MHDNFYISGKNRIDLLKIAFMRSFHYNMRVFRLKVGLSTSGKLIAGRKEFSVLQATTYKLQARVEHKRPKIWYPRYH